jgi:hypothetical protein
LPGAADVVYTNTFTVTIDQDVTVLSIRNSSATNITAGGSLLVTGSTTRTINANLTAGTPGLFLRLQGTGIVNVNGNLINSAVNTNTSTAALIIENNCTLNFNGNAGGGINTTAFAQLSVGININSTCTANLTGIFTGGQSGGANTSQNPCIYVGNINCILNITGSLIGGIGGSFNYALNALNGTISCVSCVTQSSLIASAINSSASLIISGTIINTSEINAIIASRIRLDNSTSVTWLYQTNSGSTTKTLYDVNTLPTIPVVGDVRSGVTYASGALTGTLIVPTANTVTDGVVYDNGTIGTAQNTAASFLAELAVSTDPLAERLRNVSTVQTTGTQLAALL